MVAPFLIANLSFIIPPRIHISLPVYHIYIGDTGLPSLPSCVLLENTHLPESYTSREFIRYFMLGGPSDYVSLFSAPQLS